MHNYRGLVEKYLPMMNNIVLAKMGQHVSASIPLTWINIFQVLILALFYNTYLGLDEKDNRGVIQQDFGHWTNDYENMYSWLPKKITVLVLTSIILLPTSALTSSILVAAAQLTF